MSVSAYGQPVWPGLIEYGFQDMREDGSRQRHGQNVICNGALLGLPNMSVEPPSRGQREQHVLVGSPGQCLRRVLDA
ncbi:hypothetical protein JOE52_007677 [Bradyrhizobium canariense]|nr:hypothetical protein [Bradyrhizobium canariense]